MRWHLWAMGLMCVLIFGSVMPGAWAQRRVDASQTYERCWAVVPLVGIGTITDPKRPLFAPLPGTVSPSSRTGILGYSFLASDDGHFALAQSGNLDAAGCGTIGGWAWDGID